MITDNHAADPYNGLETEEEKAYKYQQLLEAYQKETDAYKRQVYEDGQKKWEAYRKVQLEQDGAFDRNIITIAAGSFGVSFAFISSIVKLENAVFFPVLCTAWALFAACIVISLLGFMVSSLIHGKYCDEARENVKRGYAGEPYIEKRHWYSGWVTRLCNWLAFFSFTGGAACLITFVLLNAPK